METFDAYRELITTYLQRVELFVTTNKVPDAPKVLVFLTLISGQTYTLLRDLLSPEKPATKSLKTLVNTLKKYYKPKKIIMAEHFHFHWHQQEPGESVAAFEAKLQTLASQCEFGEWLNDALRDRLVCGLKNEAYTMHKWLLAEPDLTHSEALTKAHVGHVHFVHMT